MGRQVGPRNHCDEANFKERDSVTSMVPSHLSTVEHIFPH